jgi:hypothetical protein
MDTPLCEVGMIPENQLLCFGAQGWIWESEPPAPKEKPRTKAQEKNQSRSPAILLASPRWRVAWQLTAAAVADDDAPTRLTVHMSQQKSPEDQSGDRACNINDLA